MIPNQPLCTMSETGCTHGTAHLTQVPEAGAGVYALVGLALIAVAVLGKWRSA